MDSNESGLFTGGPLYINPYTSKEMMLSASFVQIVKAKLGQASAGDNEVKLMMKHDPEWVRTSDPVIRSPYISKDKILPRVEAFSRLQFSLIDCRRTSWEGRQARPPQGSSASAQDEAHGNVDIGETLTTCPPTLSAEHGKIQRSIHR